ncbi:MAG: hypothetical protein PHQ05_14635 [Sterolibacterium sp.]|nr:hypothetical protein [Sterolibacterium sp.]
MRKSKGIARLGIQAQATDQLDCQVFGIVMHQVNYTNNDSECSNSLRGVKDCSCT